MCGCPFGSKMDSHTVDSRFQTIYGIINFSEWQIVPIILRHINGCTHNKYSFVGEKERVVKTNWTHIEKDT